MSQIYENLLTNEFSLRLLRQATRVSFFLHDYELLNLISLVKILRGDVGMSHYDNIMTIYTYYSDGISAQTPCGQQ